MHRVGVKICGLTHPDDVRAAAAAGADALGFNFFPGSPRYVPPDAAAELVRAVPEWVNPVGVFVNAAADEMVATADRVGLVAVQWVGDGPLPDGMRLTCFRRRRCQLPALHPELLVTLRPAALPPVR